tara:strand:+ start:985 stop:1470 length:486 start_codon:yes stop_codon:yes gene_type:complete
MKPKSVEIYPVYICDDCGSRHCESLDYVKKIGKILCGCGSVLDLTPIETFKVSPVFKSKMGVVSPGVELRKNEFPQINTRNKAPAPPAPKIVATTHSKEKDSGHTLQYSIEQAVLLLTSLGFKKREATEKAKSAIDEWQNKNKQKLTEENFEEFANYLIFN